jgi:putative Ca2+/H+ antiporter (TMEM165/GDT1 family)
MELRIYNGEHFTRPWRRHAIAAGVLAGLLLMTLFSSTLVGGETSWIPTWTDILSTILFFSLFAAYWFYVRREIEKQVTAHVTSEALHIGERVYPWHAITSFGMEKHSETHALYSIIFLIHDHYKIHTLADSEENVIAFAHALKEYIPFTEELHLSWFEKLLRRLKI